MALGSQRGGAYDLTPFNRRVYLTMIDVSRYRERRARNVNEPTIFSLGWEFIFVRHTGFPFTTTPPAAPSGQRAADVGRYGESSRAGPSEPRSLADQSGACLQAVGCSLLGPGDNAVELPRLGQTEPLPRRKAPGIPSKIQLV
jgi:hypothetical protein